MEEDRGGRTLDQLIEREERRKKRLAFYLTKMDPDDGRYMEVNDFVYRVKRCLKRLKYFQRARRREQGEFTDSDESTEPDAGFKTQEIE